MTPLILAQLVFAEQGVKQSGHGVFNVKLTTTVAISMQETEHLLNLA